MIIAAGEALVDLVPDPVPGGGPMNVAVAAARLGAPTAFLGRVSTDEFGDLIWRHLETSGVDLSVTQRGPEPTCRAVVEGDPPVFTFHGEGTADRMISDVDLSPLGPGPHILHGGTLGMFRMPGAETYARVVENHDGIVSLDPNARPQIVGDEGRVDWLAWFDRWLEHTDILRLSNDDIAWIFPDIHHEHVAEMMLNRGAVAVIVTTARNATAFTAEGHTIEPARSVPVVDTVGAGDTFCGAMLTALYEHGTRTRDALTGISLNTWQGILDFAALAASISVSRKGADPPWRHELPH